MKQGIMSILVVAFALAVPNCGGDTQPQSGSESHFVGCADTSDCPDGLTCICRTCTMTCTDDSECRALSSAAVCGPGRTLSPSCEETKNVCQIARGMDGGPGPGGSGSGGSGGGGAGGVETGGATSTGGATAADSGVLPDGSQKPTACDGDASGCFCDAIASCSSGELFEWLPLGSRGYRVCGTAGDGCAVSYFQETEGGVSIYRCYASRGATCSGDAWSNLESMPCDLLGGCNLLLGGCPSDLLDCGNVDPAPTCAAMDPGADTCCAGYAVSTLSSDCGCVCPDTTVPLYGSLEACEAACGVSALTCAAVDPASFGDCTLLLGYGYDGMGCIGISGCTPDESLFASREECWQGCNRSCADVEVLRAELREQASGCTTDGDCMWIESGGPPYDHCSCMVAVNRTIDVGVWRNLNFAYGCYDQGACCDASPGNPVCVDGRCAAGVP